MPFAPIRLEQAIGYSIYRVYALMRADFYREFRSQGFDLTPEQWIVLLQLWRIDGCSQQELAERTFKDKHTMSRILDVLAERGWVKREPHPTERGHAVLLTKLGRGLEARLVPIARKLQKKLAGDLGDAEIARFMDTLHRIAANLSS